MFSLRALAPLVVAAGILAASPAGALAEPADVGPHARGGGAGVLTYPSIVDRKLVRTQSSLSRAVRAVDAGSPNAATNAMTAARKTLGKAWDGAKYVIQTTPPPPPAADDRAFHSWGFRKSGKLRIEMGRHRGGRHGKQARGGAPAGVTYASIYDTAFAVLSLQHYASTVAVDLVPDVNGKLETSVETTLVKAQGDRDKAIAFIHSIAPPPLPPEDRAAYRRGGAVVGSWDTVMPQNIPYLDDEIQQINGTLELEKASLPAGSVNLLKAARTRANQTEATINQYWPPLPPGD
jgi:hypothetical protein